MLVLSGNAQHARDWLLEKYPGATVENIPREQIDSGSWSQRVGALRAMSPDIFAIATERLIWQRGQNALLLFGTLAGARTVVVVDARGDSRDEGRAGILTLLPFRIMSEAAASSVAIAKSHSRLKQLEQLVARRPSSTAQRSDHLRIAYLRSTPSPGSAAGGAATHINGFVNAATELGAEVNVISNDYIAGLDETKLTLINPEPAGTTRAAFDLRNNLIFSDGVLREVEREPVDLIYQRYGRFTWAGVEASLQAGVPLQKQRHA
ncbi:MAG: hypothetical protein ACRDRT_14890, partial [Pseudonocardiaceae bacterium]